MKIAINKHHAGKHPPGLSPAAKNAWFRTYNGRFANVTTTAQDLAQEIAAGHGYTTWHKDYRKSANFIAGQHVGLDLDDLPAGTTLEDIKAGHMLIDMFAGLLHTTASHTPEAPRARVLFFLDRPITDPAKYTELAEALLWQFDQADPSCKDACRLFFGAPDCETRLTGNVLSLEDAAHYFIFPFRHWKDEQRKSAERAGKVETVASGDVSAERLKAHADALLNRVRNAPDGEKYYTLRDTARTFGGYVAGGYYTKADARRWLQSAIESRRGTVKDMRHAYATIDEGLAYGERDPLYFEVKEQQQRSAQPEAPDPEPGPEKSHKEALGELIMHLPAANPLWAVFAQEYEEMLQNAA